MGKIVHVCFQTEINARTERIDSVRDFGLGLIRSNHSSKAEIQKCLQQLEAAKEGLERAWLNRSKALEQSRTLQVTNTGHRTSCFQHQTILILYGWFRS